MVFMLYCRDCDLQLKTLKDILPYINKNDKVLDLGTGYGFILDGIYKNKTKNIKGIDVINLNKTNHEVKVYDGINIPYPDNSFDVVLCLYILHHTNCKNHNKILNEMKRVSKKIIILEDITDNIFDKFLSFFHKIVSLFKYKSNSFCFRSSNDWKKIFKNNNLSIINEKSITKKRDMIYPINRKLFVLKEIIG
jgi:SAM-dependent methyltransferase